MNTNQQQLTDLQIAYKWWNKGILNKNDKRVIFKKYPQFQNNISPVDPFDYFRAWQAEGCPGKDRSKMGEQAGNDALEDDVYGRYPDPELPVSTTQLETNDGSGAMAD